MNYRDKMIAVSTANERRGAISDQKGPEYAGQAGRYKDANQDVLLNFKRQDLRWGFNTDGLASAFVYFGKHIDSIETFAREVIPLLQEGQIGKAVTLANQGEGIQSRLDDARNYLDLIECLLMDADVLDFPGSVLVGTEPDEDDYRIGG